MTAPLTGSSVWLLEDLAYSYIFLYLYTGYFAGTSAVSSTVVNTSSKPWLTNIINNQREGPKDSQSSMPQISIPWKILVQS